MKVKKRAVNFNLTDAAIEFFTEYGEGNRSKGAERAAADLANKPRLETVSAEKTETTKREWEWILGLDTNERIHAAREYPPRVVAAIEGRPKSAYLTKSLIALKRVAELAKESYERLVPVLEFAAECGSPLPIAIYVPVYLLEEYEAEHGQPLARTDFVHPDSILQAEPDPLADDE